MNNSNIKINDQLTVKVEFLDGHVDIFSVKVNSLGSELFQKVVIKTKLIESYFFGLSFESAESDLYWLDLRKLIRKQVSINNEYKYDFCVKFYTPDPNLLQDSLTKHLFVLQLKMDLSKGEIICCDSTRVLLGAFFLQLWYPSSVLQDTVTLHSFLKQLFNDPSLSTTLMGQSLEFYKTLKDQTVEETRFDLLDTIRKNDFYGMKMHAAKDIEGMSLSLAVYHLGIVIFQKCNKINTFNWSKIRKLSFKRKRFLIKLHSEEYLELFILWVVQGFYKDTLEFYFDTRNNCKNFWKKCIEHHSFFRCQSSRSSRPSSANRFHRNLSGSRFRYVGLTQAELDQRQHEACGMNNCFHRSESMGRIISRDYSFFPLTVTNSSTRSDLVNCLSLLMEPSSPDSLDMKISEPRFGRIPISSAYDNPLWTRLKPLNDNEKLKSTISSEPEYSRDMSQHNLSVKEKELQIDECSSGGLSSQKYPLISLTQDWPSPDSLVINQEIQADAQNESISRISSPNNWFGSYEFIPKLLAQTLSSDECSYEFPVSSLDHSTHGEESTNDGSNSRSCTSTSVNFDTSSCLSILNSILKDFLFNEFTHVKELQVLKEIIDAENVNMTQIVSILGTLLSATETLIRQLELKIQENAQVLDNFQSSINRFFTLIDEYLNTTLESFNLYVQYVSEILNGAVEQVSPPICLHSSQLRHLTQSIFHAKNPLRLLLSVIFQQRNRHRCLVTINDFLLTKENDQCLCKNIIVKLKSTITDVEKLEENCQQILLAETVHGIQNASINRFGWLQRVSSKGASNRLFAVTCKEFICIKKLQSNAFIVDQKWRLKDIRVRSALDITNYINGYSVAAYPVELLTITLCISNDSPKNASNIVLLADSKQSQSTWIKEIQDAKKNDNETEVRKEIFHHKIDQSWIQDYQFVEICWHERVSLSLNRAKFLFQLVLSSYVLRKCKISSKWQRLWIVLSDFHLYFYKTHNDREAVTSLSVIGFQISEPNLQDSIKKDWVLKLLKDSKTYFLRTENQYFYLRWRTALQYCTSFAN